MWYCEYCAASSHSMDNSIHVIHANSSVYLLSRHLHIPRHLGRYYICFTVGLFVQSKKKVIPTVVGETRIDLTKASNLPDSLIGLTHHRHIAISSYHLPSFRYSCSSWLPLYYSRPFTLPTILRYRTSLFSAVLSVMSDRQRALPTSLHRGH